MEKWEESLNRSLTYKEHLMVAEYPQDMLDTMSEEDCEAEYIELSISGV